MADALCRVNTHATRDLFAAAEADLVAKTGEFGYDEFNRVVDLEGHYRLEARYQAPE